MSQLIANILPEPRRKIIFVYPDVSVAQCCEIMAQNNIGALMVSDDDNLIGIVSERDMVRSCLCKGLDINNATALDIAYSDVTILSLHDTIEKAMLSITQTKRRHVLVKEKEEIIAILSIGDLLYHLLQDQTHIIEQLENYIHS